jgi:hypothetical protein
LTTFFVPIDESSEERRHKKEFVKRTNRRGVFHSMLGVSRDGIHAFKDLPGNTTRIATKLENKFIKAERTIDVEIKKM